MPEEGFRREVGGEDETPLWTSAPEEEGVFSETKEVEEESEKWRFEDDISFGYYSCTTDTVAARVVTRLLKTAPRR